MNLQEAIKEITYRTRKFPKEAFEVVEANPEEAKPYFHEALDRAIREGDDLEDDYQLHFYGMFFLAQFRDKDAFGKLMELASLPPNTLDSLIGDGVTEGLKDCLYLTFNGDVERLVQSIVKTEIDEYSRGAMLTVLGQLYQDGTLGKDQWQEILKKLIYTQGLGEYIYAKLAEMVCDCHFIEMLKDVEYVFDEDLADVHMVGDYDSCVDIMFDYSWHGRFCKESLVVSDWLRGWAMFEQEEKPKSRKGDKDFEKLLKSIDRQTRPKAVPKVKIGRNDPCPCGSGKKYKQCCLNKPKQEQAESEQDREMWLASYPELGEQREEGRIYLEDYFDRESIEIDQDIYLALKHRPIPIWSREPAERVNARKRIYLWEAFSKWTVKMEMEGIASLEEYDKKYSIHYKCDRWLGELADLLKLHGDMERYEMVEEKYQEYSSEE